MRTHNPITPFPLHQNVFNIHFIKSLPLCRTSTYSRIQLQLTRNQHPIRFPILLLLCIPASTASVQKPARVRLGVFAERLWGMRGYDYCLCSKWADACALYSISIYYNISYLYNSFPRPSREIILLVNFASLASPNMWRHLATWFVCYPDPGAKTSSFLSWFEPEVMGDFWESGKVRRLDIHPFAVLLCCDYSPT